MAYNEITNRTSPNKTLNRNGAKIDKIVLHWWGDPATNPQAENVVNWLCNPASQVSAHFVATGTGRRVWQIVDDKDASWANGNWNANMTSLTIEADPRCRDEDYDVVAELIADLWRHYGKLPVYQHNQFFNTRCLPVDGTELLTKKGWVGLGDIEVGDEIATPHIDDMSISFSPVRGIVPIHNRDTWLTRGIEVTNDHNMVYRKQSNSKYKLSQFQDIYQKSKKQSIYIPNAGMYNGSGVDLTDNEIKLLVAIQADGHYMYDNRKSVDGVRIKTDDKKYYGVSFHLKKQRKIDAVIELLEECGYEFNVSPQRKDGSFEIYSYDKNLLGFAFKNLDNKMFKYELLEMSPHQAELFLDTLLDFDGTRANKSYSSTLRQNIDIVAAIASINGVGTREYKDVNGLRLFFLGAERAITPATKPKRRLQGTKVSCVTVDTGVILVRQHGRTTIVGNCAGNYNTTRLVALTEQKLNGIRNDDRPDKIKAAYREILKREADTNGLNHYLNQMNKGWTIEQVRSDLMNSSERKQVEAYEKAKALEIEAAKQRELEEQRKTKAAQERAKAEAERLEAEAKKAREEEQKIRQERMEEATSELVTFKLDPESAKKLDENNSLLKRILDVVKSILDKITGIFK